MINLDRHAPWRGLHADYFSLELRSGPVAK